MYDPTSAPKPVNPEDWGELPPVFAKSPTAVLVNSWDEVPAKIASLLEDPATLIQLQIESYELFVSIMTSFTAEVEACLQPGGGNFTLSPPSAAPAPMSPSATGVRSATSTLTLEKDMKPGRRRFDDMALLVVGGEGRHEHMRAIAESWGSVFQHRLFIDDTQPEPAKLGAAMSDTVNIFADLPPGQDIQHAVIHKNSSYWQNGVLTVAGKSSNQVSVPWFISQAKYLLGLQALVARFPAAKWYLVVDSDTFIYPYRLGVALDLFGGRSPKVPVALGHVHDVPSELEFGSIVRRNRMLGILLGGAGTVLSRGAVEAMDLDNCTRLQLSDERWNQVASDWRMVLCLQMYGVRKINVMPMYQSNDQLDCREGMASECRAWIAPAYRNKVSPCALSFHYIDPEGMRTFFARDVVVNTTTCVPADDLQTHNCVCHPGIGMAAPDMSGDAVFPSIYKC